MGDKMSKSYDNYLELTRQRDNLIKDIRSLTYSDSGTPYSELLLTKCIEVCSCRVNVNGISSTKVGYFISSISKEFRRFVIRKYHGSAQPIVFLKDEYYDFLVSIDEFWNDKGFQDILKEKLEYYKSQK